MSKIIVPSSVVIDLDQEEAITQSKTIVSIDDDSDVEIVRVKNVPIDVDKLPDSKQNNSETKHLEDSEEDDFVVDVEEIETVRKPWTIRMEEEQFRICNIKRKITDQSNQLTKKIKQSELENNNNDILMKNQTKDIGSVLDLGDQKREQQHQQQQQQQQRKIPTDMQIPLEKNELMKRMNAFVQHQQGIHNQSNQKEFVEQKDQGLHVILVSLGHLFSLSSCFRFLLRGNLCEKCHSVD
jgi:hypothetical protein